MKELLNTLIKLQEIDTDLHRYEVQRDELRSKLSQLQDLIGRMEKSIEEKRSKLAEVESWYKSQVEAISQDSDRITKLKNSLANISKTKEYTLRQREIDGLRKARQLKEDELKKAEQAIEEFKLNISEDENRLSALKEETAREGGSGWDQVEVIGKRIEEISKKKNLLLPSLPSNMMRRYETIRRNRDGLAVVPVIDHCCGGCHVQIRAQLFNNLLRFVSIENCPQCSRFVYIPKEEMEAILSAADEPLEAEDDA